MIAATRTDGGVCRSLPRPPGLCRWHWRKATRPRKGNPAPAIPAWTTEAFVHRDAVWCFYSTLEIHKGDLCRSRYY